MNFDFNIVRVVYPVIYIYLFLCFLDLDACAICPCAGGGMVGTNLGKKNCTSIFVASSNVSNDFCGDVFLRGMFLVIIFDEIGMNLTLALLKKSKSGSCLSS